MNELLPNLIEALREELKEYGEMLALLEQEQEKVIHRNPQGLLECATAINSQAETIAAARHERTQHQRHVALALNLPEQAGFLDITPLLPPEYRPLIQALVQENNQLLNRIQQKARQNHLLLSRIVELMQRFLGTLFPELPPSTYNDAGHMLTSSPPHRSVYDAVG